MPTIFVPPLLRTLTDGLDRVEVPGLTVRQALSHLDERYPGIRDRLCVDGELRTGTAVAVDGHMSSLGLRQKVTEHSEIHFLPAIGGG